MLLRIGTRPRLELVTCFTTMTPVLHVMCRFEERLISPLCTQTYNYKTVVQLTDECFGCFPGMTSSNLQNVNKSLGARFQMLLEFLHFMIFLNIHMGLIIVKYRRRAV